MGAAAVLSGENWRQKVDKKSVWGRCVAYFGNCCDYFCQNWQFQQQKLSSTKACRPFAELLLLELTILTKIITIITKIMKMLFRDFQGAAAAFSGENWRQKCQKVEKSRFGALCWLFWYFLWLFLSRLTVPAAKALMNKGLPAFWRAFAAGTVNFDKNNYTRYFLL